LSDHPRGAPLLGWFVDGGAAFFVADGLVQDSPDQAARSMGNGPDGLIMSQTWDRAAVHHFEDRSFGFYSSVRGLME
jgi:hypothetical protein